MESTNHSIRNPRNTPPGLRSSQTDRLLKLPSVTPSGVLPGRHHQNPSRPARIPPRITTLGFPDFGMLPPSKLNWQDKSLVGTAFFGEFGAEIHHTDTQSSFEWLSEMVQTYNVCRRPSRCWPIPTSLTLQSQPALSHLCYGTDALLGRTVPQPFPGRSTQPEPAVRGHIRGGVARSVPTADWGGQRFRSVVRTPSSLVPARQNRRDLHSPSPPRVKLR